MVNSNNTQLDGIFQALADPTRRTIIKRLLKSPLPINEIAKPFSMSLVAISKHIKVLEKAKLITRKKVGRENVCELQPTSLKSASEWLSFYETFWTERFDALDELLKKGESDDK